MACEETGTYNFTICQGTRLFIPFLWRDDDGVPVPFNGRSARMQIRAELESSVVVLDMSSDTGEIIIEPGGETGVFQWLLGADVTAALDSANFDTPAVYDMEVFNPADATDVVRLLAGTVELSSEVTRP